MAKRGEIFVLDMGEPVKILTLAENMIRLSGLEPYKDIEIREIGLRPGEKLYEELLISNENLIKTSNQKIFVEHERTIAPEFIMRCLTALDRAITGESTKEELIRLMKQMVPTYFSPEQINNAVALPEDGGDAAEETAFKGSYDDSGSLAKVYNFNEAV